jgi:hypothetical protein
MAPCWASSADIPAPARRNARCATPRWERDQVGRSFKPVERHRQGERQGECCDADRGAPAEPADVGLPGVVAAADCCVGDVGLPMTTRLESSGAKAGHRNLLWACSTPGEHGPDAVEDELRGEHEQQALRSPASLRHWSGSCSSQDRRSAGAKTASKIDRRQRDGDRPGQQARGDASRGLLVFPGQRHREQRDDRSGQGAAGDDLEEDVRDLVRALVGGADGAGTDGRSRTPTSARSRRVGSAE